MMPTGSQYRRYVTLTAPIWCAPRGAQGSRHLREHNRALTLPVLCCLAGLPATLSLPVAVAVPVVWPSSDPVIASYANQLAV